MAKRNLSITFEAADFGDGDEGRERAWAAARRTIERELASAPAHATFLRDGALIMVYEPYPVVGSLTAVPQEHDIILSGPTEMRSNYEKLYLSNGRAVMGVVDQP